MDLKPYCKKRGVRFFLVFSVIAVAIFAVYLASDRECIILNPQTRAQFGGTYAHLPVGTTHYMFGGPDNGPVVVLLHGATVSIWDFDLQVEVLQKGGFRVLRFDALGRGLSNRPEVAYTRSLHETQLVQLLDHLQITQPVVLLGHSLGGAAAVNFAAKHPSRVRAVSLISPVINSINTLAPFIVCNTPVLGLVVLRLAMIHVLRNRANGQWTDAGVNVSHYEQLFERQISIQGFEHAVCSMFQTDLVGDYRDSYKKLGQLQIPGLLVYGENDGDILATEVEQLVTWMPKFSFVEMKNAQHSAHVEYKEKFNHILLDFLKTL